MSETRKQFYKRQLADKNRDLACVESDLDVAKTQEERRRLLNRSEQLLKEIDDLDGKIQNSQTELNLNQANNYWEQHLHKIDHKKAIGIIEDTFKKIDKIDRQSRAALFLVEKSSEFCGRYCIKHLRDRLEGQGTLAPPFTVEFMPGDSPVPDTFLKNLAEKLARDLSSSQEANLKSVLDGICGSIKGCNILFLHINLEWTEVNGEFMTWIIEHFWCRLIDRLPQLSQYNPYIKLVGVVSIDKTLPKPTAGSLCCKRSQVEPTRFQKLPQEKWREKDIHKWLCSFSQLPPDNDRFLQIAQKICNQTKGVPDRTNQRLLDVLEKLK